MLRSELKMEETNSFLYFFLACRRRFKRMTVDDIQDYQLKKTQKIVDFAVEHSPFFKKYYQGYDLHRVGELPLINKKIMMDNLTEYNTVGFSKQEMLDFCLNEEKLKTYNTRFHGYNVAMSSGTSGNKGIVITSPAEEKYLQAAFFARFPFPPVLPIRWAFILRITTPAFNVKKFGQRLHHISLLKPRAEIISEIQELNPNIISAPPSMLQMIAKEVANGTLSIDPKRIISYAEVLSNDVKEEIEHIFGMKVFQVYQCSEGGIALPCKYGSLHINEDLVHVQTLNIDGSPTPPGIPCHKMLVTDLHKRSQPIIRFELNDIITTSAVPCECGSSFRVIAQIMGRADDLFLGLREDSNEEEYIFPDYIGRAIIQSSEDIEQYQAIQKGYSKIIIRITPKTENWDFSEITTQIENNIRDVFRSYKCQLPQIEILSEAPIINPMSQKLIRIHRDFKH